jgi:predicted nucleic acid-binding Zn ribbon protein
MGKDATPIREVTKDVIRRLSKERSTKEERIKKIWYNVTGKKFRLHTQPVSFRKNILTINVDSSGWLYELTMRKKTITAKLKKELKDDFKQLRFRIGKIER